MKKCILEINTNKNKLKVIYGKRIILPPKITSSLFFSPRVSYPHISLYEKVNDEDFYEEVIHLYLFTVFITINVVF